MTNEAGGWQQSPDTIMRISMIAAIALLLAGCGDEGMVNRVLPPAEHVEHVAAAPMWIPDAITMDELIFPYAAKQCVGIHDIRGDVFRLASCEVLYKSRRVRYSERDNRWVRLSTGNHPAHATHWTHDGVPQFIYFFLNFDNETDYQQFGVGRHSDVIFSVANAFSIGKNKWEVTLLYKRTLASREPDPRSDTTVDPVDDVIDPDTPTMDIGGRRVAVISLSALADLAIEQGRALRGREKVISTGVSIVGEGWVRIDSGRNDVQVFIYAAENVFDPMTSYHYLHVSIDRVVETRSGQYELWLTYIP